MKKTSHKGTSNTPHILKYIWILLSVVIILVLCAGFYHRVTAPRKLNMDAENKVIGTANNKEIIMWEYLYFAQLVKENTNKKTAGFPDNQVMDRVKAYKAELIKANEDQIALTDKEKNMILTNVKENEKRLKNGMDLFWDKVLFQSIDKQRFIQMQINLAKIDDNKKRIENQMSPTESELQQIYNQEKEGYRIPERAKVYKLVFFQDQQTPKEVPAKATACLNMARKRKEVKLESLISSCKLTDAEKENSGESTIMKGLQPYDPYDKLFNLQPGDISNVMYYMNSYLIYQMEEVMPETYRSFIDPNVQSELMVKVKEETYREVVNEWMKETDFQINNLTK